MLAYLSYLWWGGASEETGSATCSVNGDDTISEVTLPTTETLRKRRANLKPIPARVIETPPLSHHPVLRELLSSTPRVV